MRVDDVIARFLAPVRRRMANMIVWAVTDSTDDSKGLQELRLSILADETRDGVVRAQNYGFTSVPKKGAEAVVLRLGANSDQTLVIAVDDRKYRLKGLADGEVAMFDCTGSKMVMKANGDIEATPSSGTFKITGDLAVSGDVTANGVSLENHQHEVGGASTNATISITSTNAVSGSPVTASSTVIAPTPGNISGKTGKPA
jgi:phage gp45-like